MPKRRKYSAEFKGEAVALAHQSGVTKAQIGRELDINPNMITRWQRELAANGSKALLGQGVAHARSANSRHHKILQWSVQSILCCIDPLNPPQRSSRKARSEVSGHRSLSRSLSDTSDVPLSRGVAEWLLRLAGSAVERSSRRESTLVGSHPRLTH